MAIAMLYANTAIGQEPGILQYVPSPLTVNPALTGPTQKDYRITGLYDRQWVDYTNGARTSTNTGSISFDATVLKNKLPKADAIGLGIYGAYNVNDISGTKLHNESIGLSLAYHKAIGKKKLHTVSLGALAAWNSNQVLWSMLYPSYNKLTGHYYNINAGITYAGQITRQVNLYSGISFNNINNPVEKFSNYEIQVPNSRLAYVSASFDFNRRSVLLLSYANTAMMANSYTNKENVFGASLGFKIGAEQPVTNTNNFIYFSLWYSDVQLLTPYIGLALQKIKMGVSYNFDVASQSTYAPQRHSLIFSLSFGGNFKHGVTPPRNIVQPGNNLNKMI